MGENRRGERLNGVLGSLEHILEIDSFAQKRNLRKIVSDGNGWHEKSKDAADDDPAAA